MSSHHTELTHPISLKPLPIVHHRSTGVDSPAPQDDRRDTVNRRSHSAAANMDVEPGPKFDSYNDPYRLAARLKSFEELGGAGSDSSASKNRHIRSYYTAQNENIERLLKPVEEHRREAKAEADSDALQYKIAVYASLICNVVLAILQCYGAAVSGSLSLITTLADALFDPLSNAMLFFTHRAVKKVNPCKYPSGKARIETAGNISFCFAMFAVSVVIIVLSIKDIAQGNGARLVSEFHLTSIVIVGIACLTKLALFLYCHSLRNKYSQVRILWEDHRNDVVINGVGLATAVLGAKVRWWIDPAGAIVLSTLILGLWLSTAHKEMQLLIGVSADPSYLQLITYISMTHSPDIIALDTVRAWHSGPRLIVEVDIVIDPMETVKESHDIAEALQSKLESLPNVERAYVHVDYETDHAPEHFLKKEL